jgi:hypothetical protein
MTSIFVKSIIVFGLCLGFQIFIWRILVWQRSSLTKNLFTAFPILFIIFFLLGGVITFWISGRTIIFENSALNAPSWVELLGISLFHIVLSTNYILTYTSFTTFSPSMELLGVLDKNMPQGLPIEYVEMPLFEDVLIDGRISNMIAHKMIQETEGRLTLLPRGQWLARTFLSYRHILGLPDGGGG